MPHGNPDVSAQDIYRWRKLKKISRRFPWAVVVVRMVIGVAVAVAVVVSVGMAVGVELEVAVWV